MKPQLSFDPERVSDICRRWGITELSLFGSVLTPRFAPASDVDVLVTFAPDSRIGFLELAEIQDELSATFGRHVDIVPKDGLKSLIRDEVLRSAQVLYAA